MVEIRSPHMKSTWPHSIYEYLGDIDSKFETWEGTMAFSKWFPNYLSSKL